LNKQELMEKLQDEASFIGCETYSDYAEEVWPLVQSAILAEREACAKICDSAGKCPDDYSSDFLAIGDIYAAQIRARSNAPETEKEIIVRMPPKSRQAGFFTINDYQTLDPGENVALDPVSA